MLIVVFELFVLSFVLDELAQFALKLKESLL